MGHPRARNSDRYRPEVVQGSDEGAEKLGQLRSARVVVLQQPHLGRDVDDDELRLLGGVECLPEVKLPRPAPYEQHLVVNPDVSGPTLIERACRGYHDERISRNEKGESVRNSFWYEGGEQQLVVVL